MKSKITQLVEKLGREKDTSSPYCDVSSSRFHTVNIPIPSHLFHELEAMSVEYNRDVSYMASNFLTLALEEAIEHIPGNEKKHLDYVRHEHDHSEVLLRNKQCEYNAGGT